MNRSVFTAVFKGAVAVINSQAEEMVAASAVDKETLQQVAMKRPWSAPERAAVRRTLELLTYASMEAGGLDRFAVNAEYMAAIIKSFVSPINYMPACHMFGGLKVAEQYVDEIGEMEPVTPQKLFVLLQMAFDEEMFVEKFNAATEESIKKSQKASA